MNHEFREDRTFWVMLVISIAAHGALAIAAGRSGLHFDFEPPQRDQTSISVRLIAAATLDEQHQTSPPEPTAREVTPVREASSASVSEHVLVREDIAIERTPHSSLQLEKPESSQEQPRVESPRSIPKRNVMLAAAVEVAPPDSNSDRSLLTNASSGAEHVAIDFGTRVEPRYPQDLWLRRVTGDVEVLVSVGPEGRVVSAKIYKSSGYAAFDESALNAVRQWQARPVLRAGLPATQDVIVPISFRIRG